MSGVAWIERRKRTFVVNTTRFEVFLSYLASPELMIRSDDLTDRLISTLLNIIIRIVVVVVVVVVVVNDNHRLPSCCH